MAWGVAWDEWLVWDVSGWWFVVQCLLGGNDGGRMGSASSRLVTRVARPGSDAPLFVAARTCSRLLLSILFVSDYFR